MSAASIRTPVARAHSHTSSISGLSITTDSDVLTSVLFRGALLSHNSLSDLVLSPQYVRADAPNMSGSSTGSAMGTNMDHLMDLTTGAMDHSMSASRGYSDGAYVDSPGGTNMAPNAGPVASPSRSTRAGRAAHVISRGAAPHYRSVPPKSATPMLEHVSTLLLLSGSVAASIPFYDLSHYSPLLNTLNLLQLDDSGQVVEGAYVHRESGSHSPTALLLDQFNQVPPRFSRFILDQRSAATVPAPPSSRDISWLMGSQATVFSTRADGPRRRHRSVKATRMDSTAGAPETALLLTRRRVIRFKPGGRLYRLRLTLRKLALRLRRRLGAVRTFFAAPRKASSKVQTAAARPFFGRQRLVRQAAASRTGHISAPLANPGLGAAGGALRVAGLTGELKAMAGFTKPGSKSPRATTPGRTSLARYVSEERRASSRNLASEAAALDSSAPPPPPPHVDALFRRLISGATERSALQGVWRQYLANVLALRIRLRQEVHLYQRLLAEQPIAGTPKTLPRTVKTQRATTRSPARWLASIADIKSYRASIVPGKSSSTESEHDSLLLNATASSMARAPVSETHSRFTTDTRKASATSAIQTVSDFSSSSVGSESDEESIDEKIDRLQQVLNRRSMLGQMLDYDSDELDSLASSTFSCELLEISVQESRRGQGSKSPQPADTQLIKRYGTLRRRPTDKSSFYGSSNESSPSPDSHSTEIGVMSRSPGFSNLQIVSALPEEC
ncbi:hypothetical protein METBIDRAFT_13458 [Metschnikowia bicuspidata var. bicuspidata NRRL YB-4993]|uniref:Uncharacterized protein n=1 Tax=Metschnikowia bicuspidata var. bicuspidata NRRL YB-4993 TaxID=869754 RepID=A0A1A0H532_9ASCO|nr:hypothetical protein METBIDRAFT_13458 [Metschnikowia bicuspidata var. bicuspidata NRRL YB-4993]OBA19146.1 hypothetical protein METBIDRAFT_13458 [Metschnikowia bicuspidata var. bicuspidata NRRL YB-4993]